MRVLLVRPRNPRHTLGLRHIMICEPLELETVAAGVVNHDVLIIDEILGDDTMTAIRSFQPHVVGTSSYITGVDEVLRICRMAKEFDPSILTVVGGVHATVVPENFCKPHVDIIVCGEGTVAFKEILMRFSKHMSLDGVPGTATPAGPVLRMGPEHRLSWRQFENLPLPRRDLTHRHRHKYYYLYHKPVTLMRTSLGCPYRCTFCFCWKAARGQFLNQSPERIVEELKNIDTREVYIVDDTFLLQRHRLLGLAEHIRRRNIHKEYLVYGRSDFIAGNEDVIREWAAIGLKAVIIGLEYTSDPQLEAVEKGTSLEQNDRAIEVLQRNNIDVYASFILEPEYEKRQFRELNRYIMMKKLYYVVLQPLTPLPKTPLFEKLREQLTVDLGSYPIWDLSHLVLPSRMSPRKFYWQIAIAYLRATGNPLRLRKLNLRTVPRFLSYRFLRLMRGAYWVLGTLLLAHRHHRYFPLGSRSKTKITIVPFDNKSLSQLKRSSWKAGCEYSTIN